jgi:hypothetical protein
MLISVAALGLLASLDPLRPAVFVMVLRPEQARVNAISFLIGWSLALAALFSIGFAASHADGSDRYAIWSRDEQRRALSGG